MLTFLWSSFYGEVPFTGSSQSLRSERRCTCKDFTDNCKSGIMGPEGSFPAFSLTPRNKSSNPRSHSHSHTLFLRRQTAFFILLSSVPAITEIMPDSDPITKDILKEFYKQRSEAWKSFSNAVNSDPTTTFLPYVSPEISNSRETEADKQYSLDKGRSYSPVSELFCEKCWNKDIVLKKTGTFESGAGSYVDPGQTLLSLGLSRIVFLEGKSAGEGTSHMCENFDNGSKRQYRWVTGQSTYSSGQIAGSFRRNFSQVPSSRDPDGECYTRSLLVHDGPDKEIWIRMMSKAQYDRSQRDIAVSINTAQICRLS